MSDLWHLWNPFSKRTKHSRAEARRDKTTAEKIREDAVRRKAASLAMLAEQRSVSDELREQKRRNHFGDMFTAVPIRPPQPKRS